MDTIYWCQGVYYIHIGSELYIKRKTRPLVWSESGVGRRQLLSHVFLKPVQLDRKLVEPVVLVTVGGHRSCTGIFRCKSLLCMHTVILQLYGNC